jgi:hypothetical protein
MKESYKGYKEAGASALGLAGSQEKAGSCPNKMLALYYLENLGGRILNSRGLGGWILSRGCTSDIFGFSQNPRHV